MEKITIPGIGTFRTDDLYHFFHKLSSLNGEWHHFDLTEEEHMKLKTAVMTVIRDIFTKIEYTGCESNIRYEHRSFDSDDQERFYRNMWSHQKD